MSYVYKFIVKHYKIYTAGLAFIFRILNQQTIFCTLRFIMLDLPKLVTSVIHFCDTKVTLVNKSYMLNLHDYKL